MNPEHMRNRRQHTFPRVSPHQEGLTFPAAQHPTQARLQTPLQNLERHRNGFGGALHVPGRAFRPRCAVSPGRVGPQGVSRPSDAKMTPHPVKNSPS